MSQRSPSAAGFYNGMSTSSSPGGEPLRALSLRQSANMTFVCAPFFLGKVDTHAMFIEEQDGPMIGNPRLSTSADLQTRHASYDNPGPFVGGSQGGSSSQYREIGSDSSERRAVRPSTKPAPPDTLPSAPEVPVLPQESDAGPVPTSPTVAGQTVPPQYDPHWGTQTR
jgi:hypothetical protein